MYVYKMFKPGLVCRDYQFKIGLNECDHATCVKEGFHAAENPLDCLTYYPNFDQSECWLCYADGDIHEDGITDTRISCTRLEILRRLGKEEFVCEAIRYVAEHPRRPLSRWIKQERGETGELAGFVIVKGKNPIAKANQEREILAWITEDDNGNIVKLKVANVPTRGISVGKWYDSFGNEVSDRVENDESAD